MAAPTTRYAVHGRHPNQPAKEGNLFAVTYDPGTRDRIVADLQSSGFTGIHVTEGPVPSRPPLTSTRAK